MGQFHDSRSREKALAQATELSPSDFCVPLHILAPHPNDRLDAIFVMFRARYAHLAHLLTGLNRLSRPVFFLGSAEEDLIWFETYGRGEWRAYLDYKQMPCYGKLADLSTNTHPHSARKCTDWDLDLKRNSAIWLATRRGFRSILLLDDDVSIDWQRVAPLGVAALRQHAAASLVPTDFPDVSCVDHAALRVGRNVAPSLSGNCLFVNVEKIKSFFAPIYNEDWLFMLEQAVGGAGLVNLGNSIHAPYEPFADPCRPRFQEFGEIVLRGQLRLACERQFELEESTEYWAGVLHHRAELLVAIIADFERCGLKDSAEHRAVTVALERSSEIGAVSCVEFMRLYRKDAEVWTKEIQGSLR